MKNFGIVQPTFGAKNKRLIRLLWQPYEGMSSALSLHAYMSHNAVDEP